MSFTFFVDNSPDATLYDKTTVVRLKKSYWDDYGFGTTFTLSLMRDGIWQSAGTTKIAQKGMVSQGALGPTHFTELGEIFTDLGENYFSVGQDASLYSTLVKWLGADSASNLLRSLRDLASIPGLLQEVIGETVAYKSLFREVTMRTVRDQYQRILEGTIGPQAFTLKYKMRPGDSHGPEMNFIVEPSWPLPSNVHVIIGSNGTGKTTTLQNIRRALDVSNSELAHPEYLDVSNRDQISGLVSVSFSAFDVFPQYHRDAQTQAEFRVTTVNLPWVVGGSGRHSATEPSASQPHPESISAQNNLTDTSGNAGSDGQLTHYIELITKCLETREERLLTAFRFLADADAVLNSYDIQNSNSLRNLDFPSLSSGHKIVLLTVASLVRYCEEKTLVLLDEPESHLHPPLLGAFTRALSWLMTDTNGLAIVATHSAVVLQEVPRRCAWKVWSVGLESDVEQPTIETFGENLGVLTREVFGLELDKSGYHAFLNELADRHTSYDDALEEVSGEIGDEAKLLLRSMIRRRNER